MVYFFNKEFFLLNFLLEKLFSAYLSCNIAGSYYCSFRKWSDRNMKMFFGFLTLAIYSVRDDFSFIILDAIHKSIIHLYVVFCRIIFVQHVSNFRDSAAIFLYRTVISYNPAVLINDNRFNGIVFKKRIAECFIIFYLLFSFFSIAYIKKHSLPECISILELHPPAY